MGACWGRSACWHRRSVLWCQISPWAYAWHLPGPSRLQRNTKSLFMSLFTYQRLKYKQWIPEKRRRISKAKGDGSWFCFAEFSIRLHFQSYELCYLCTLSSMPQAPQQPFVPDSQGAHYAQGLYFLQFFTLESIGNPTVVRRWVCYTG